MANIDDIQLVKLSNGEYISGSDIEIDNYCREQILYVERWLNHVNPSSVQKGFKYVGSGRNPYELKRGFDYSKKKPVVDDRW